LFLPLRVTLIWGMLLNCPINLKTIGTC